MNKKKPNVALIVVPLVIAVLIALVVLSQRKNKEDREVKMTKGKSINAKGKAGKGSKFTIKLLYNTSEGHKTIAETLKEQWHDNLGVDVELVNKEWKVYQTDMAGLKYNMGRAGWIADYRDPVTFLDMFLTNGGNNQTGWSDKHYDGLIEKASVEPDPATRMKLFAQAEDYLINTAMPIMPIYYYVNKNVLKPYVKGMPFNLRDIHPLKYVWIEKDGQPAPPGKQVFTFNNGAEPKSLDPAIGTGNVEFNVFHQIYIGLLQNNPETLDIEPAIATRWDVSPDKLTYTFHLRKDAKWSNGDPITANDFFYSWKRVLEPATASEYAYQLHYIKNGKAYNSGKLKDFSKVGLKALDDYTLQVKLEHPTAYWLDLVAFPTLMPVNKKCVEKYGDRWTRAENIVTNGPFKMTGWKPKEHIILVKNPNYYDAGSVRLQKIVIQPIEDLKTALDMFKTGETEWVTTIPPALIDQWIHRPETHITPFLAVYYYRFNVTKPPFNDVRVRKAFNLATDKEALCKYVMKAGEKPATTFVPPGIPGYHPPKGPGYNPEEARRILREAGYAVKETNK